MSITANFQDVLSTVPSNIKLVAVSKTKPNEDILEVYNAGHKVFGENKVQELVRKSEELPKDIEWHFIGHLQSNKVKYIAPFVGVIHAVDSLKLLRTINKEGEKNNRVISCLLQFHVAEEESKFGLDYREAADILESNEFKEMTFVKVVGVMGMATFTNEQEKVRGEFITLKNIFDNVKSEFFAEDNSFKEISMGMSGDYLIAIEEGSTMVRVGSNIFGFRNYH
jgi:pyridoxal phosphate enzyme (YggS family)